MEEFLILYHSGKEQARAHYVILATWYPAFSTAFRRISSPISLSQEMRALPFERLTTALTPSIWFRIFVTSITQWAQFIPDIFIVLRLTTRPASFFFGIFPLPGQLPPAGHPMHFTPFFFALIMYAAALPIRSARIMITIMSAITNHVLSISGNRRQTK